MKSVAQMMTNIYNNQNNTGKKVTTVIIILITNEDSNRSCTQAAGDYLDHSHTQ